MISLCLLKLAEKINFILYTLLLSKFRIHQDTREHWFLRQECVDRVLADP